MLDSLEKRKNRKTTPVFQTKKLKKVVSQLLFHA